MVLVSAICIKFACTGAITVCNTIVARYQVVKLSEIAPKFLFLGRQIFLVGEVLHWWIWITKHVAKFCDEPNFHCHYS